MNIFLETLQFGSSYVEQEMLVLLNIIMYEMQDI